MHVFISLEVKTAVFLSLSLAQKLLRTPIPKDVLDDIAPGNLKTRFLLSWLQRVGLFNPEGRKWGRISYIIFVCFLYDNFVGLGKSIFPPKSVIRNYYPNEKNKPIVWLYIIRALDLAKNRILVK